MHKRTTTIAVLLSLLTAAFGLASCSMDEDRLRASETVLVDGREAPASAFEQGTAIVLLSEELADGLDLQSDPSGQLLTTGVKSVDGVASSIGIKHIERLFRYNETYEPRLRANGMHLWYVIEFDGQTGLTRAGQELSSIEGVELVEYCPKVVRITSKAVSEPFKMPSASQGPKHNKATELFNDPRLDDQWHYYNDGTGHNAIAGADINVLPVWETGNVGNRYASNGAEVIVAVVDGGVDASHEDLAENMWVDPSDGSNGYNYVDENKTITPDEHGTHVAGTVAAVNNNGIGVCGVAGGDKAAGVPGVRIMSQQIFKGEDGSSNAALARAIQEGADKGAVISQNSWGFEPEAGLRDTPAFLKTAIDYFAENAGMDADGKTQVGPMAGGLVVFAAGNDELSTSYPASYETCLAVASIAADYEPAYYTNYGSWVDVCAPGGDYMKGLQILSTTPGNTYTVMQGTSMACPHVSGMAALIVSSAGGPGFTAAQLREMIEGSARDISQYASADYTGRGLVDVAGAFNMLSTIAPDPVTDFAASSRSNFIDFTFSVPRDEDNVTPATAKVYYSTTEFDVTDSAGAETLPCVEMVISGMAVGDQVKGSVSGLEFNTQYYLSVSTSDAAHNRSELSPLVTVTTGENTAPVFLPDTPIDTTVKQPQSITLDMKVFDADGHTLTPSVDNTTGVSLNMLNDSTLRVVIASQPNGLGSHTFEISVSDGFASDSRTVNLEVMENRAPEKLAGDPDDVVVSMGSDTEIDLAQYVSDPDGDRLTYRVEYSVTGVVMGSVSGNILTLTPQSQGTTDITVTALDDMNEAVTLSFTVLVRDGGKAADFYPNPVIDMLNVRTGTTVTDAVIEVRKSSGAVVRSTDVIEEVSPFAPAQIDMSGLAGGMYNVTLKYTDGDGNSQSVTSQISKL